MVVDVPSGKDKPSEEGYTVAQLAKLLGTTPARIRGHVQAGLVEPRRGPRGEYRFSFQDVVLLRSAQGMSDRLPARRVRKALRTLRARLPSGGALAGVQIRVDGDEVVVQEQGATWDARTGQLLMDFDGQEPTRAVASMPRARSRITTGHSEDARGDRTADDWFEVGVELEMHAPKEASQAYERALAIDPGHADACINLGRLAHDAGDRRRACDLYEKALKSRPDDVIALFNLGVALDDDGRLQLALETYQRVLALDPLCADAHYNAARICEQLGDAHGAFRHLRTYRSLQRRR